MTITLAAVLAVLNILAMAGLSVNAWVHKVTGKASLEARLAALEDLKIATHLTTLRETQVRQEAHLIATDQRVDHVERRVDHWTRV